MKIQTDFTTTYLYIGAIFLALLLAFYSAVGQATETKYDPTKAEKTELKAHEILPESLKKLLKGDHYSVNEKVINVEGMNSFTIKSDFGDLVAESNYLLRKRIREFPALAELSEITRGEALVESQVDATMATVDVTVEAVKHPIETAKAIPGGVLRLFSDGYEDIKEGVKFVTGQSETEGLIGESLGTASSIRAIAKDFRVDPYTRNPLLQEEMKRLAWFMAAGKKAEEYTRKITEKEIKEDADVNDMIWDLSLAKLIERNKGVLVDMGIEEEAFTPLLQNQTYIPSEVTSMITALETMKDVQNRKLFIEAASQAQTIDEAVFYLRTAELLAMYQRKKGGLKEIVLISLIPTALTDDQKLIIVSPIDYAVWTKYDSLIIDRFLQHAKKMTSGKTEVWVEGLLSPRAEKELVSLGVKTFDLTEKRLQ